MRWVDRLATRVGTIGCIPPRAGTPTRPDRGITTIWVNGALYDRDSLPAELAILFGTSLGLSPVCYLRESLLRSHHLEVLGRAAGSLGYSGFAVDSVAGVVTPVDGSDSVVTLVPTVADHRAIAPGADWMVVTAPFDLPDASVPLRLDVSRHRRNHHSPTINALVLGDGELLAGSREAAAAGFDEVVWLNLDDHVSCIGAGALFAEIDRQVVTPPLTDGVLESAWRAECIDATGAREQQLDVDDLLAADSVACVWPWGAAQSVAAIGDHHYADGTFAIRLAAAITAADAAAGSPR